MWKKSADIGHLRNELDLARRTSQMLTDTASAAALRRYIFELEDEIGRRGQRPRQDAVRRPDSMQSAL